MEFLVDGKLGAPNHSAAILTSFHFKSSLHFWGTAMYFLVFFNLMFGFEIFGADCAGKQSRAVTTQPVSLQILCGGHLLLAEIAGEPTLAVHF